MRRFRRWNIALSAALLGGLLLGGLALETKAQPPDPDATNNVWHLFEWADFFRSDPGQRVEHEYVDADTLKAVDWFEVPQSATNPANTTGAPRLYWNTTVDSLRVHNGTDWINLGQRGDGYYELHSFTNPRIDRSGNMWADATGSSSGRVLGGSDERGIAGVAYGFCIAVKGYHGVSSYTFENQSPASSRYFIGSQSAHLFKFLVPSLFDDSGTFLQFSSSASVLTGVTCFENIGTGT